MSEDLAQELKQPITRSRYVTIFGAGVAGLTAAHELVERGFRVQVWEPVSDQRDPRRGLDVGGLARTQWSRVNWRDEQKDPSEKAVQSGPIHHFLQKLFVLAPDWRPGTAYVEDAAAAASDADAVGSWVKLQPLELAAHSTVEVMITGICHHSPSTRRTRVELIFKELAKLTSCQLGPIDYDPSAQLFKATSANVTFVAPLREPLPGPTELMATVNVWPDPKNQSSSEPAYWRFWAPWDMDDKMIYGLCRQGRAAATDVLAEFLNEVATNPAIDHVFVEVTARDAEVGPDEALRRAAIVKDKLKAAYAKVPGLTIDDPKWGPDTIRIEAVFLATAKAQPRKVTLEVLLLAADSDTLPPKADAAIGFRARERWLPGEHGFRFFPAFYHHLFDTMKRTPILETEDSPPQFRAQELAVGVPPSPYRYVETGRSTFDNLQPSNEHALAFSGHRPSVLTRSRPQSFEQLRDYMRVFYGSQEDGGFDADPRDVSFFMLRLYQYMTSCDERRKQYEGESWWDFIEGDSYETGFANLLLKWPKALVAMDAKSADARTNGTTTVQITLDLFRDGGYRDGILKGPTNAAWLEHWRRYLEAQGVEFVQGRLDGLRLKPLADDPKQRVVTPQVTCFEPRYPVDPETNQPHLLPGYFLLALPAHIAAQIASDFRASLTDAADREEYCPPDSDLARAADIDISAVNSETSPKPIQGDGVGEFRNYAGIQFYFAEDVFWLEGQVYHPDSAFGLTTVSQARFWEEKMDWEHGYRGVLSAIIANWSGKAGDGRCAYELTPQELSDEVWSQISESVKGRSGKAPNVARARTPTFDEPPKPLFWHLDDNIKWETKQIGGKTVSGYFNGAPFHIVPPGKWRNLPGELDDERGYQVHHGIVLAGTYTKTYTRIPCMETANESARHAVNAILRAATAADRERTKQPVGHTYCDIWNPEDREMDDLGWMKELDAKLVQRGRAHVFEIYGIEKLIRFGLRGGKGDPFDPIDAWRNISHALRKFSKTLWAR